MATNLTSTVEFDTRAEALEWLGWSKFFRLPVKGPRERWCAYETGDDGEALITFATSAGIRDMMGNVLAFNLVTTDRK